MLKITMAIVNPITTYLSISLPVSLLPSNPSGCFYGSSSGKHCWSSAVARPKAKSASNAVIVSLNNLFTNWFAWVLFSDIPSSANTVLLTSCNLLFYSTFVSNSVLPNYYKEWVKSIMYINKLIRLPPSVLVPMSDGFVAVSNFRKFKSLLYFFWNHNNRPFRWFNFPTPSF